MYKITLDQAKVFECNVSIQGATVDNSKVRLVLESNNVSFIFKGEIDNNGKVRIPISKLKGLLKENTSGKLSLEVIADDTFFTPWSSDYKTETMRKVEVSFDDSKPMLENKEVKVSFEDKPAAKPPKKKSSLSEATILAKMLINEGVNVNNIAKKPKTLNRVIESFIKEFKPTGDKMAEVVAQLPGVLYDISEK